MILRCLDTDLVEGIIIVCQYYRGSTNYMLSEVHVNYFVAVCDRVGVKIKLNGASTVHSLATFFTAVALTGVAMAVLF